MTFDISSLGLRDREYSKFTAIGSQAAVLVDIGDSSVVINNGLLPYNAYSAQYNLAGSITDIITYKSGATVLATATYLYTTTAKTTLSGITVSV